MKTYTGSVNTQLTSLQAFTASSAISASNALITASASSNVITFTKGGGTTFSVTVGSVIDTGSFATTASFNAYTGSTNAFTASMKTFTGSIQTQVNALEAATSSYVTNSQTSSMSVLSASYATIASTVQNGLNISASNITVTNNLTVNGTASFAYTKTTTGSAVIIGDEFIILNADTPTAPFAGIMVYDTGSASTASFEWNGNGDYWIAVEETGQSSAFLTGASGSKGSETFPSANRLTKGTGNNTIIDSNITDNGSTVSINSNTLVTGSLNVSAGITGSLLGTASFANNATSASFASTATSASFATTASFALNVTPTPTGSFATTGSNTFNGNQIISGSVGISGSLVMNGLSPIQASHVKANDVQGLEILNNGGNTVATFGLGGGTGVTYTGQINALAFSGSGASIFGVISSSYASNSQTAFSATSASYANNAGNAATANSATSASYASNAQTAFSATSASFASNAAQAETASFVATASNAVSSSYANTATSASFASTAAQATSASYSLTATSASYSLVATSASYAANSTSASYALNATSASVAVTASFALTTAGGIQGSEIYSYTFLLMGA